MIRRRFLLTSLAGALALPLVAAAQQVTKVYRLAIVYEAGHVDQIAEPILLPELQRLGYVEGRNLVLIRRSGGGRRERYPDVAREVVGLKPDVIFAPSGRMAEACRMISGTIPIVTITSDPVALGLAGSLQRPGGNITGFTVDPGVEVIAKRFELLRQAVPNATRVAFLTTQQGWDAMQGRVMRKAGQRARVRIIAAIVSETTEGPEYRRAFSLMVKERAQAVVVSDHREGFAHRGTIVELAAIERLPAIYPFRAFVEAGGLMAYALDPDNARRRVADYIDRILRGADPAQLPFQQPTTFHLTINLTTAKALGLTIPPSLLARADQVIE
jgi:putative tryptophan/tyrosine transport system substrate-binding protein